jgi:hypothetical protein
VREIKISTPKDVGQEISKMAVDCGAKSVSLMSFFDPVKKQEACEIRVKASTPLMRQFVTTLVRSPLYSRDTFTVSSHEIRSLLTAQDILHVTKPFCIPVSDVEQDLWQNSHITASFVIRVITSAMLLTYGMLADRVVLMIGAMLFTIFSPPLMAIGFGISRKDKPLMRHAIKAFIVANVLSVCAASLVAAIAKGPLLWNDFGSLASNVFISVAAAIVGATADMDDIGRRQLIAVAAAFPYSRFPPWIGIGLVLGFPDKQETLHRLGIFAANIGAMIMAAGVTYSCLLSRSDRVPGHGASS